MDWSDLAPLISTAAPTLGRLLGGAIPLPFGSVIGESIGRAVAAAVGDPNAGPDQVAATIKSTHADVVTAQLAAAEREAAAKWQALAQMAAAETGVGVAQVQSVGESYRGELLAGAWYQRWWRPLAMYVWIASWPAQLGTILWHIASRDPQVIAQLSSVIAALTAWNAGPAALAGIYGWRRTTEKLAAANGKNDA